METGWPPEELQVMGENDKWNVFDRVTLEYFS